MLEEYSSRQRSDCTRELAQSACRIGSNQRIAKLYSLTALCLDRDLKRKKTLSHMNDHINNLLVPLHLIGRSQVQVLLCPIFYI